MKLGNILFAFLLAFVLACAPDAYAKDAKKPKGPKAVSPSPNEVALPEIEEPAPVEPVSSIPALPPSQLCKLNDIKGGVWKLMQVYEEPEGSELQSFRASPSQYLIFFHRNTYARYNSGRIELGARAVITEVKKHTTGLLQYLVQDAGLIYFYQDKVATDTQACFIVARSQGPFIAGQMLLMPPRGQIKGRLVKVYKNIYTPPPKKATPPRTNRRVAPQNR